jgi:pyruvate/2-oxoacid:ferredoxin oxidoreductase beta subunit
LTTGQASPTTPLNAKTNSTPEWNQTKPFDPIKLLESAGCGFVKKVDWKDLNWMKETIKEAIQYEWFAHINVNQPCPSWRRW